MSRSFSIDTGGFHEMSIPEEGYVVGYAALRDYYELPIPNQYPITIVSKKNRKYKDEKFQVLTIRYLPEDNLYKHLTFALKYEGVNLLVLKKIFEKINGNVIEDIVRKEPTSQYARKIWFLYEWLLEKKLPIEDADIKVKYVKLVNERIQYALSKGEKSARHRIENNLLGSIEFCPHVFKSKRLLEFENRNLDTQQEQFENKFGKGLMQRASSFLLLADSKASFTIEGESPKSQRLIGWSRAIGQAGKNELNIEEIKRLQKLVIEKKKHIQLGLREEGGFIGEHDNDTFEPVPEHISANAEDLASLINGLVNSNENLVNSKSFDSVVAAAIISFGFVFIHPFVDGNGRIHRYIIHHLLAKKKFSHQGIIFPVSASILNKINDYRKVLKSYSNPLLDFIEWESTSKHNVKVLNDTKDLYRYFDCTQQAEFLYECVVDTIETIIPAEIDYLQKYDEFKTEVENEIGLPDNQINLLVKFMQQNNGKISKRRLKKEFENFDEKEVLILEEIFRNVFSVKN